MFIHKSLGRSLRLAVMTLVAMTLSLSAWAQNISVSGTVTDKSGEPVIGAYVLVQGTTNGTSTDIDGKYQLNAPAKGTLVFTMVGMKEVTMPVNNRSVINAIMEEDSEMLEEAVITAEFGLKRTARSVGSAAQNVKAQDIARALGTSLEIVEKTALNLNKNTPSTIVLIQDNSLKVLREGDIKIN